MKLATLAFCFLGVVFAQDAGPEVRVTPLGVPCEPGEPSPFGPEFPISCPPVAEQGIMAFVRATDEGTAGFRVTVKYTTAEGEEREAVQTVTRNRENEWSVAVFQIGRVKTERLPGITVGETRAEALAALDAAAKKGKSEAKQ